MSERKNKEKRLEEKEKWDAEVARSLSVIELKKAHKQIEDVEKARKRSTIQSIIERLSLNISTSSGINGALINIRKKESPELLSRVKLSDEGALKKYLDNVVTTYESIRFDLQRNLDIRTEDFDRLFPKIEVSFNTYSSVTPNLSLLNKQMLDMKAYCLRLL